MPLPPSPPPPPVGSDRAWYPPPCPPSPPSAPCPLPHPPPPLSSTPPTADQSVAGFPAYLVFDPLELESGPVEIVLDPLGFLTRSHGPLPQQAVLPRAPSTLDQGPPTINPVRDAGRPRFDRDDGQLILDGKVCKTWSRVAPNQWGVIKAFEEGEWRRRIENPRSLDDFPLLDEALRETVRALNRKLKYIRFYCDGTGKGVILCTGQNEAFSVSAGYAGSA